MGCDPGPLQKCRQESQKAEPACKAAGKLAEGIESKMAATASQAAPTGGISSNGQNLSGVASSGAQAAQAAANSCRQAKQNYCDSPCAAVTCSPDSATAKNIQQSCDSKLDPEIAKHEAAAKGLSKNSDQAKDSSQQAQAPQMPQASPAADSPAPESTTTPELPAKDVMPTAAVNTKTSCDSENAYLFDQCADQLMKNCVGNAKRTPVCESFTARYCKGQGSSGQSSAGALKAGEGKTSSFCTTTIASDFCERNPEAQKCPSCSHESPAPGVQLPEICANDPAFANPEIANKLGSAVAGAGGGGGGSGGGSGMGSSASVAATGAAGNKNANAANDGAFHAVSGLGVDGGGGGGGSAQNSDSGGDNSRFSASFAGGKRAMASVGDNGMQQSVTDVASKGTGPSVFMISSEVISARCRNGRFLHCPGKLK